MENNNKEVQRNLLEKIKVDIELRYEDLIADIEEIEKKEFGFADMLDHLTLYKKMQGRADEARRQLERIQQLINQLDDLGYIAFDWELPF